MSDLISRQDAIDAIDNANDGLVEDDYTYGIQSGMEKAKYIIEGLPSVQPEIIRCKDCVLTDGNEPIADGRYWCMLHGAYMHYCSDAERRTDERFD